MAIPDGAGEAVETAPKRRHDMGGRVAIPQGRNRINFDSFEAIVGLTATRVEATEGAVNLNGQDVTLPSIDGPSRSDFDQYRREVEGARNAGRKELLTLCGTLLFNWSMLYQEWAGIDGKTRNHWRFALLRFADYLGQAPELSDLTAANLDGVSRHLAGHGGSATQVLPACEALLAFRVGGRGAWRAGRPIKCRG